jgi:hypothetical protein
MGTIGAGLAGQPEKATLGRAAAILQERENPGGSDDDSVLYCDRDLGKGVLPNVHDESEWELDFGTNLKRVRPRRCRKHPGEHARYICKDHYEVLCPKCLVAHKICDFEAMGPMLSHDARQRFRHLLTRVNVRYNHSQATIRKVLNTIRGLDVYRDKQVDDINFCFDELITILNARRDFLIGQVSDMITKLKVELRVDEEFAVRKRDEEATVLERVRDLQNFVFAVTEKEDKRVMVKWKDLDEKEKEF